MKFNVSSFELQHMLDDINMLMKITLNYYIIVNKFYLENYSDKITLMIMS